MTSHKRILSVNSNWFEFIIAITFSLAFALIMIPKEYLSEKFLYIGTGDTAVYSAGALGFLKDSWHYPPFNSNLLGPDQLSITLFDAIPLAALITKVINSFFDLNILNYIGPWTLFVYFMQPISAWIAVKAWKIKSYWITISIVITATFFESFQFRILHNALQSHFLIILAIALYPRVINCDPRKRGATLLLGYSLLLVSTLVHTYLAMMVFFIMFVSLLELTIKDNQKKIKKWFDFSFYFSIFSMIFLISYTVQGVFGYAASKGGWQVYSMNPLSPFIPRGDRFVEGQYEGLNYLGVFGISMLIIIYMFPLLKSYKSLQKKQYAINEEFGMRRTTKYFFYLNWFLSLGTIVYLGSDVFIDYQWFQNIPLIDFFTSSFRAPGRLFWINSYLILFLGGKMLDVYIANKLHFSGGKLKSRNK
jgi:hypothetical protein